MKTSILPIRAPAPEPAPPGRVSIWRALHELWAIRPCWMCGARGPCGHREPEVDAAWLQAKGVRCD